MTINVSYKLWIFVIKICYSSALFGSFFYTSILLWNSHYGSINASSDQQNEIVLNKILDENNNRSALKFLVN